MSASPSPSAGISVRVGIGVGPIVELAVVSIGARIHGPVRRVRPRVGSMSVAIGVSVAAVRAR